jgi:hypothetical protein
MESTKKSNSIITVNGVTLHKALFKFIKAGLTSAGLAIVVKNTDNKKFYTIRFGTRKWQGQGLKEAFVDVTESKTINVDSFAKKTTFANLFVDQNGFPHIDAEAAHNGNGTVKNEIFTYSQRGNGMILDGTFGLNVQTVSEDNIALCDKED